MKRISREEFNKELDKYYIEKREAKEPYIRLIRYGLWEIFDGENTVVTSHDGYREFGSILRKAVNEEIKKIKDDIRDRHTRFD